MPSGISHMLFSYYLPFDEDSPYRNKIKANTRYFQIGSIAPDLPYAGIIDDSFFESENDLANLFHFTSPDQDTTLSPNKIPLLGLTHLKNEIRPQVNKRECDALFWFLVGYASHVIADGVCHPFVMDKVGRYEGQNKTSHRVLEMGIDVLVFEHFTSESGHAVEASYAGRDSFIRGFNEMKYAPFAVIHFAEFINSIYAYEVPPEKIHGWISGMSRLFCLSTGKWPDWIRQIENTVPFIFREIEDVEGNRDDYLVLEKPEFWERNFLGVQRIHFLDDCLPRYNHLMKSFLDKAYDFVYGNGPQINENDLPAFSLDTGRSVNDPDNILLTPVLWEEA